MASGVTPLLIVSIILVFGAVAKIVADRYRIPSIIFLLLFGILLGPSGLDIVTEDVFSGALSSIVGFAVAIIVFEGAFHLDIGRVRRASKSTIRLVTIGALIAFLGTAVAVFFVMDASVEIALLIAALLVATGPTVITPIMSVVDVRPPVETAMETEGIVNDVSAAILAVVIFEAFVLTESNDPINFAYKFGERLFVGIAVGLVGAYVLYRLAGLIEDQNNSEEDIEIVVLVGAVAMFASANYVVPEAGVAAVAISGIILGNIEFPFRADVGRFAGSITPVVLSLVFIILAALVEVSTLIDLLWYEGLIVVLLIVFIIRPLLVFISCYDGLINTREKIFISFVGPRGIIPASVASLFAIDLRELGMVDEANLLVSTVFLVIFATVFIEAGPARYIAERLKIKPMKIIIVGGGKNGQKLSERLQGHIEGSVTIIEEDKSLVEDLRKKSFSVVHGDGTKTDVLEEAGIERAESMVAMTNEDDTNLLSVKIAEANFDVENIYAKVNEEDNEEAFEELGIETVSSSEATAIEFDNLIERPIVTRWMDNLGDEGDISDIVLEDEQYEGMKVSDFNEELPSNCLIALIKRNGDVVIPDGDTELELGDDITFVMKKGRLHDVEFICQD